MRRLKWWSAAASGGRFAEKPGNPVVNNVGCAAAAVIRIDVDGIHRTVLGAGAAFHAAIPVDDSGFSVLNLENAVGADLFAVAAADAFILGQL